MSMPLLEINCVRMKDEYKDKKWLVIALSEGKCEIHLLLKSCIYRCCYIERMIHIESTESKGRNRINVFT